MKPLDIRIALMRAAVKPVEIARDANPRVSSTLVYRVIDGQSTSDRIQRKIAAAINQPVEKVFPDKYPTSGKSTSRQDHIPDRVAV